MLAVLLALAATAASLIGGAAPASPAMGLFSPWLNSSGTVLWRGMQRTDLTTGAIATFADDLAPVDIGGDGRFALATRPADGGSGVDAVIVDATTRIETTIATGVIRVDDLSPNGRYVSLVRSLAATTRVLDRQTGEEVDTGLDWTTTIFLSDDLHLATVIVPAYPGDQAPRIAVRDLVTRTERELGPGWLSAVSRDGLLVAIGRNSVGAGHAVPVLHNLRSGTSTTVSIPGVPVEQNTYILAISPDARFVMMRSQSAFYVVDRAAGTEKLIGATSSVTQPSLMSDDGKVVVTNVGELVDLTAPIAVRAEPAVLQRGETSEITVTGGNFVAGLSAEIVLPYEGAQVYATVEVVTVLSESQATVRINVDAASPSFDLRLLGPTGAPSNIIEIGVGDLRVVPTVEPDYRPWLRSHTVSQFEIRGSNLLPGMTVATDRSDVSMRVVSAGGDRATIEATVGGIAFNRTIQPATITLPNGKTCAFTYRVAPSGLYKPVAPVRVLDTRLQGGPLSGGSTRIVRAGAVIGNSPDLVDAVVINLTGTEATSATFLSTFAAGTTRPATSSLNLTRLGTRANLVTVPVNANGDIEIYNHAGSTHVIVDVVGYYGTDVGPSSGATFVPVQPTRWFDSRYTTTGPRPQPANSTRTFDFTDTLGVTAAVFNVTVTEPTSAGFGTVFAAGTERPGVSSINFVRGETVPNLMIVPLSSAGSFSYYNSAGSTHSIFDLVGYMIDQDPFSVDPAFTPIAPTRVLDTRTTVGGHPVAADRGEEVRLVAGGAGGIPSNARAIIANVTVTEPVDGGWVRVYPGGQATPAISNLNFVAGQTVANQVIVPLGPNGTINLQTSASRAHLIVDVVGWIR